MCHTLAPSWGQSINHLPTHRSVWCNSLLIRWHGHHTLRKRDTTTQQVATKRFRGETHKHRNSHRRSSFSPSRDSAYIISVWWAFPLFPFALSGAIVRCAFHCTTSMYVSARRLARLSCCTRTSRLLAPLALAGPVRAIRPNRSYPLFVGRDSSLTSSKSGRVLPVDLHHLCKTNEKIR